MGNKNDDFHQFLESRKSELPLTDLNIIRNEIVQLLAQGYTRKIIFEFLKSKGYNRSYSTMRQWVWRNIDAKEIVSRRETSSSVDSEATAKEQKETSVERANRYKKLAQDQLPETKFDNYVKGKNK